jgi:DNA polymerase-3 subunit gamma/tau
MRDSQSLFDQLLAFGGKTITAADVHRLLGTASDERLIEIADGLVGREPALALTLFDAALAEGVQLGELVDQILDYHRDLMVIAAGAESTALLSVASTNRAKLAEQARRWGLPTILAAVQLLAESKTKMQRSGHGRALAELVLVRLTMLETTIDLATLVEDLRSGGGLPADSKAANPKPVIGVNAPRQPSVVRSLPTPKAEDEISSTNDATRPLLPLEPGQEPAFWSQLVTQLPLRDLLRDHAGKAENTAIIGPNHLEVLFPAAYHMCKAYCEQPAAMQRLEKIAAELAGRPVRITCRLESPPAGSVPAPVKPVAPKATANERQPTPETNDPFAEKARSIFGATIVRVETGSTPKRDSEAAEE